MMANSSNHSQAKSNNSANAKNYQRYTKLPRNFELGKVGEKPRPLGLGILDEP